MAAGLGGRRLVAIGLLAATLLAPSTALANGEIGDHVKAFEQHIDDYAADVAKLDDRLDALAERYAQGENVAGDVKAVVEAWEAVKYHAAVETVATPLYPPIWQAISGLRQAVKSGEGPGVVRERAEQLTAALHEGLGGLKLKAAMTQSEGSGLAAESDRAGGPEAAFQRIRKHLDSAVAEYADGNPDGAKQHIHNAYFNEFEGLEGGLIEQDPELV